MIKLLIVNRYTNWFIKWSWNRNLKLILMDSGPSNVTREMTNINVIGNQCNNSCVLKDKKVGLYSYLKVDVSISTNENNVCNAVSGINYKND